MESSNLNNSLPENDDLDAQLRAHFSAPPLVDNGFSQRVMMALPGTRRNPVQFNRRLVCAVGLAAGIVAALIGLIRAENLETALASLDSTLRLASEQLLTAPVGLAVGLAVLSMAFAFREQWRQLRL